MRQLPDVLTPLIDSIKQSIRGASIGVIVSYDKTTHLAQVKDILSVMDSGTGTTREPVKLTKTPVFQLGNHEQGLKFVPRAGHPVLIVYLAKSIQEWLASSGNVILAVQSKTLHHISHAVAIYLGGTPEQWKADDKKDTATLKSLDKWWIGSDQINLVKEVYDLATNLKSLSESLKKTVDYKGRASSGTLTLIHEDLDNLIGTCNTIITNVDTIKG